MAIYGLRGGRGGIPQVMLNLINGLAHQAAPVQVHVLFHGSRPAELQRLAPAVRIIDLGEGKRKQQIRLLAHYLHQATPATLLCQREDAARRAFAARRRSGTSTRIVVRVGTHNSTALRQRNRLQRFFRKRTLIFNYRHADRIIAVSPEVAEDIRCLADVPRERVIVLPNPSIPADVNERARQPVDHVWFVRPDPPVIASLGRLVRIKDYPTLLRAFARLHRDRRCRLIIFGDGNKRQELLQLAQDLGIGADFDLPGFVPNPYAYISRAALFVLSSLREGSPNALIEAMSVGTPVVATDCPSGPRSLLQDGKLGPLVPPGNVRALADAMRRTLDSPPDPAVLRKAVACYRAMESVGKYLDVLLPSARPADDDSCRHRESC